MSYFRKILLLLTPWERKRGVLVVIFVIGMAIFEVVGIASILPFLAVLANPELIQTTAVLNYLYTTGGFSSINGFLIGLGAAAFGLLVLAAIIRMIGLYIVVRFVEMRRHSISTRLLETYLRQPYEFYLNRHTGELSKGILSEVDQITNQVFVPLGLMIGQIFTLLAIIILLLAIDPAIAVVTGAIFASAYGAVYMVVRSYLGHIGHAKVIANQHRFEATSEALGGIKDIKMRGCEDVYLEKFSSPAYNLSLYLSTTLILSQVPKFVIEAIAFGGILLLSLVLLTRFGGHEAQALGQVLPLLGLYAFAGYRMLPAVQTIYQASTQLRFGLPAVDALLADLTLATEEPASIDNAPKRLTMEQALTLDRIYYRYPEASGHGLKDISIVIPSGSSLGVVGTTGAGKTTLIDVILGLLSPTSGKILVDGTEINRDNIRPWQASMGYVPQEIFLVDTTVAQNIAFGVSETEVDADRVKECARLAQIDEFIETKLSHGYDTQVGERGIRLSGGQRQRIGIARALYHDPDIIVFDEATSALDNRTEKEVMKALKKVSETKTIIVIAHRLSTVRLCDQIVVLDKGSVAGLGSYEELEKDNPAFMKIAEVA